MKRITILAVAAVTSIASAGAPPELDRAMKIWAAPDPLPAYKYALVDLNEDRKMDAIVLVTDPNYCGSGGCTMAIFKGTADGFEKLTTVTITREPIYALRNVVLGWHTLSVVIAGGGATSGQALLRFNGKRYPTNPSVQGRAAAADLVSAQKLVLETVTALVPAISGREPFPSATYASMPPGLCDSYPQALFSCRVGEKTVSVCMTPEGSPAPKALTYRFGLSRSQIELEYPSSPEQPSRTFWYESTGGGPWAEHQLSFSIGRYKYTVVSYQDRVRDVQTFSGVAVSRDKKVVTFLSCNKSPPDADRLHELDDWHLPKGEHVSITPPRRGK